MGFCGDRDVHQWASRPFEVTDCPATPDTCAVVEKVCSSCNVPCSADPACRVESSRSAKPTQIQSALLQPGMASRRDRLRRARPDACGGGERFAGQDAIRPGREPASRFPRLCYSPREPAYEWPRVAGGLPPDRETAAVAGVARGAGCEASSTVLDAFSGSGAVSEATALVGAGAVAAVEKELAYSELLRARNIVIVIVIVMVNWTAGFWRQPSPNRLRELFRRRLHLPTSTHGCCSTSDARLKWKVSSRLKHRHRHRHRWLRLRQAEVRSETRVSTSFRVAV